MIRHANWTEFTHAQRHGWSGLVLVACLVATVVLVPMSASGWWYLPIGSDPQVAKTLWLMEHGPWALIGPPRIAFIVGVSVLSITKGDPSRWYGYLGPAVGVVSSPK